MRNHKSRDLKDFGLTAEYFREHFHYNPETGALTRIKTTNQSQKIGEVKFNTMRYRQVRVVAGHPAYRTSRLIWTYMTGEWPKGVIDHINGDTHDERWCNLRDVSQSDNVAFGAQRKGKTLPKGLTKYYSRIMVRAGQLKLGVVDTVDEGLKLLEKHHGN
jgi:hypothetical protein